MKVLRISQGTVRRWTREGMTPIDAHVPYLWAGSDIASFVGSKNKPRQPMQDGHVYCVACRRPVVPDGGDVHVAPRTITSADLVGTCPKCGRTIYRRVRLSELEAKAGRLTVRREDMKAPVQRRTPHPEIELCEGD